MWKNTAWRPQVPLSNPFGIEPDSQGRLIIASFDQHVIYRLSADRKTIELIAGTGAKGFPAKQAMQACRSR